MALITGSYREDVHVNGQLLGMSHFSLVTEPLEVDEANWHPREQEEAELTMIFDRDIFYRVGEILSLDFIDLWMNVEVTEVVGRKLIGKTVGRYGTGF